MRPSNQATSRLRLVDELLVLLLSLDESLLEEVGI